MSRAAAASAAKQDSSARPIIIVKRNKKVAGGHHGGAWKVAYADFVTAMMAFFMVMWLVASVSKEQRAAIFEYFRNPSMEQGKSTKPAPGQMGPGGASTSPINLRGALDAPRTTAQQPVEGNSIPLPIMAQPAPEKADEGEAGAEADRKQLEALMDDLKEAIGKSQALEPFKDQLLLDIMPEGLRIQIVDASNRPMFDLGAARMKDYTVAILQELAPYLNTVKNRIVLSGHTDITPYAGTRGYTNWELSADRANAARRALAQAGLHDEKIAKVVGMGSTVLFDKTDPKNPINRRISLVVMTKEAEDESLKMDLPVQTAAGQELQQQQAQDAAALDAAVSEAVVPAAALQVR
jgi:chemotaxis protein MotB